MISGDAPLPAALRELVERGSTVVEHRQARELAGRSEGARSPAEDVLPNDVDRVVFWAPAQDPALTRLANACARREASARREAIVFVAGEPGAAEGVEVSAAELYIWPRDEDRLKMAFLTGA